MSIGVQPYGAFGGDLAIFTSPIYMMGNYVIPDYLNELEVTTTATLGKTKVKTGAAITYFKFYINDAEVELSHDAAANNRIDRIVLRNDGINTVRLTVVKGVVGAVPNFPAITAEADLELAWVWIPSGFNPAADTIPAANIHDVRPFKMNGPTAGINENLMPNSEFIAYSQLAAGNVAPERWRLSGVPPTSILGTTLLNNQIRGRAINIQAGAGNGMLTQVRVGTGIHTIKGCLSVTSGAARIVVDATTIQDFYPVGTGFSGEFLFRKNLSGEVALQVIANPSGAADFTIGQLMIVPNYVPGHFRNKHEIILLDTALTDAAWTATAKSTGVTTINMAASFGAMLVAATPIRGLIVRLRGNDSGSAGGACGIRTLSTATSTDIISRLNLDGVPNDDMRDVVAYAPMQNGMGTQFYLGVLATGVNTLDATVEILGIVT